MIRYKKCVNLTAHYELSQEELDKIYNFLGAYENAMVVGNKTSLTLSVEYHPEIKPEIINAKCTDSKIDGIRRTVINVNTDKFPFYSYYTEKGNDVKETSVKPGINLNSKYIHH